VCRFYNQTTFCITHTHWIGERGRKEENEDDEGNNGIEWVRERDIHSHFQQEDKLHNELNWISNEYKITLLQVKLISNSTKWQR
jgi:hypothetical protein